MRNENVDLKAAVHVQEVMTNQADPADAAFAIARRLLTPVWVYDIDHCRVIHANAAACHLWQAENEEQLRSRDMSRDMSSTVAKRLRQYQIDFFERDASFKEMWTLYPKGEPTSVMVVFRGFLLTDGRMAMLCEVVGQADDAPENLRSVEALLHTDVMVTLYEKDGVPFYMNPAARNAETMAYQTIAEKFVNTEEYQLLTDQLDKSGEHRMVANVRTISGPRWHDLSVKKCSDAVTGKPALLVTAVDVSELKIARDKARYLADRDQLTGCYNRAYLQQHVEILSQYKSGRCALIYFDVDRFKQINDRLGHEMGDTVLKEIAARASRVIRQNDTIVRLGGDEFVILFEDTPPEAEFAPKLERLREMIAEPIVHESNRVIATASMGVVTFVPGVVDFAAALREADVALYVSKQSGRNRVTYFTEEMGAAAAARDLIELELKRSIGHREFVLYFQPRIDLNSGKVVSAEALIRWQHPQRGLILPGEFIPVCEETGMIEDLGQLIVEMGCEQAIAWHRAGFDIGLSLNISPRQFADNRLLALLEAFSRRPDFPRGKIELEMTETVLVGDHGLIGERLGAIADLGYRIAIDDFGTGYSNLTYISRFPLHCLKIDQSFIRQLPKSGPVINLVLTLAKQIGATVVAEGVETQAQLEWLRMYRCDQAQGYLLSRPVEVEKMEGVVSTLNARADLKQNWSVSQ